MDEALTQLGVGAVIAILIIREVLAFLKTRNGNNGGNSHKPDISSECIRTIARIEDQVGKIKHGLNNNFTIINGIFHQSKELRAEVKELKSILRRMSQGNDSAIYDEDSD
jgi:hypothetical protein